MCTHVVIACGLSERSGGPGDWSDGAGGRDGLGHGGPRDSARESGQDDLVRVASTRHPVPEFDSRRRVCWNQKKRTTKGTEVPRGLRGQRLRGWGITKGGVPVPPPSETYS